ncbi:hypothetical protein SKAU_G00334410 [Synaphobranchus kaupii]|uniref:Uncharacterized protein n=1 Tax=Synaphobranchus kaupii TaxID=118154 RepID=A0A9Q1ELQ5_SYNKA|nr:hypothetical protein SKAU_G00334410 [Synaphobranchus kaupii]
MSIPPEGYHFSRCSSARLPPPPSAREREIPHTEPRAARGRGERGGLFKGKCESKHGGWPAGVPAPLSRSSRMKDPLTACGYHEPQ